VATPAQERGQLLEAEEKRLAALASQLAAQRQEDGATQAAQQKAHSEAMAAQQRRYDACAGGSVEHRLLPLLCLVLFWL